MEPQPLPYPRPEDKHRPCLVWAEDDWDWMRGDCSFRMVFPVLCYPDSIGPTDDESKSQSPTVETGEVTEVRAFVLCYFTWNNMYQRRLTQGYEGDQLLGRNPLQRPLGIARPGPEDEAKCRFG